MFHSPLQVALQEQVGSIRTYTGRMVQPLAMRVEDVCIADIAHALSHVCRFTGHCRRFYSVAEHCLAVSFKVPPEHALRALLHDASEAYICDVARPLKYTEAFAGYREIEERLEKTIFEAFCITGEPDPSIKEADRRMLATEMLHLMSDDLDYLKSFPYTPYNYIPKCIGPTDIEAAYRERFLQLTDNNWRMDFNGPLYKLFYS